MTPEDIIAYVVKNCPEPNAFISALASKGFRIVPYQPTKEMVLAGWNDGCGGSVKEMYQNMLDAAPSPMSRTSE